MEVKYWKVSAKVGAAGDHRIDIRVINPDGSLTRGASMPVTREDVSEVVTTLFNMMVDGEEVEPMERAHELAWHAARHVAALSRKEGKQ